MTGWLKDHYLFLLWTGVPVFCFSMISANYGWYCYPAYIGAAVLAGICGREIADVFLTDRASVFPDHAVKRVIGISVEVVYSFVSIFFSVREMRFERTVGKGGIPSVQFGAALQEFKQKYGTQYSGCRVYIEDNDNSYKPEGEWENDYVCNAELTCDFRCEDGGVAGFLNDPGSILCLDSDLWDQYSGVLTGHVILEDNTYLIFSSSMY